MRMVLSVSFIGSETIDAGHLSGVYGGVHFYGNIAVVRPDND